jgi:hypothetical protein
MSGRRPRAVRVIERVGDDLGVVGGVCRSVGRGVLDDVGGHLDGLRRGVGRPPRDPRRPASPRRRRSGGWRRSGRAPVPAAVVPARSVAARRVPAAACLAVEAVRLTRFAVVERGAVAAADRREATARVRQVRALPRELAGSGRPRAPRHSCRSRPQPLQPQVVLSAAQAMDCSAPSSHQIRLAGRGAAPLEAQPSRRGRPTQRFSSQSSAAPQVPQGLPQPSSPHDLPSHVQPSQTSRRRAGLALPAAAAGLPAVEAALAVRRRHRRRSHRRRGRGSCQLGSRGAVDRAVVVGVRRCPTRRCCRPLGATQASSAPPASQ